MRKRLVFVVLVVLLVAAGSVYAQDDPKWPFGCGGIMPDQGCTVFYGANDQIALGGNNEDWRNPFTYMWFFPGEGDTLGRVYFGFDNFYPQGGMNEAGLFFDGLAIGTPIKAAENDQVYPGNLSDKAMAECATVDCVAALFEQYDRKFLGYAQLLFGDAAGGAIIIQPDTILHNDDWYFVATNFYQTKYPDGRAQCWRYRLATDLFAAADGPSVDLFRTILSATHQVDGEYATLYSNIYDLKNQQIYLYLFHDFETEVVIDLASELEQGAHLVALETLFPPNPIEQVWSQDKRAQRVERWAEMGYDPSIDPSGFDVYVGQYVIAPEIAALIGLPPGNVEVSLTGDTLSVYIPGASLPPIPLYPNGENSFFYTDLEGDWDLGGKFVLDASGQVASIQIDLGGGQVIELPRLAE